MSTKRNNKSYSFELKLDAVTRVLAGESVKIVAKQLEVIDPDYIYKWIDKYQTYGEVGLKKKINPRSHLDKNYVIREVEMENEIIKKSIYKF
jgi:transposase